MAGLDSNTSGVSAALLPLSLVLTKNREDMESLLIENLEY